MLAQKKQNRKTIIIAINNPKIEGFITEPSQIKMDFCNSVV